MNNYYFLIACTILASVVVAITFAELSGIPDKVKKIILPYWNVQDVKRKKYPRRIKPFDCSLCLSFWICLSFAYWGQDRALLLSFVMACAASVVSVWIMKLIRP